MGISTASAKLLLRAKRSGVNFSNMATIGSQTLYVPNKRLLELACDEGLDLQGVDRLCPGGSANEFFRFMLGAEMVTSIDYSSYEEAEVVIDLNKPIPAELCQRFDVVIDGGTMEHVFDVRQVLSNYMNMVKSGGHIFIIVPANNLVGHGFYQFSPELFYRSFSKENGFDVNDVLLIESPFSAVERSRRQRIYITKDPKRLAKRIRLVNCKPLTLFVHATKIEDIEPFNRPPLQSDYVVTWSKRQIENPSMQDAAGLEDIKTSFSYLTVWQELRRIIRQKRRHSLKNKKFFRRLRL